jgi:hypothetical protein
MRRSSCARTVLARLACTVTEVSGVADPLAPLLLVKLPDINGADETRRDAGCGLWCSERREEWAVIW